MHEDRVLPCLVATQVGTEPVLVVVGGIEFNDFEGLGPKASSEVYHIGSVRWITLEAMLPTPRGSLDCAVKSDGEVLAIAGSDLVNGVPTPLDEVLALKVRPRDLAPQLHQNSS